MKWFLAIANKRDSALEVKVPPWLAHVGDAPTIPGGGLR